MRKGFTLVELSIVLVVVGLLIGGALMGQSMIENAKIQAVLTDINKYQSAQANFKAKYYYLPGDMPTAADYWSGAANGDGDEIIDSAERPDFWNQLALAGYIKGTYGTTNNYGPEAQIDSAYFFAWYVPAPDASTANFLLIRDMAETAGALDSEMAVSLDTKLDNGLPTSGSVMAVASSDACILLASPTAYNLNSSTADCRLLITLQ